MNIFCRACLYNHPVENKNKAPSILAAAAAPFLKLIQIDRPLIFYLITKSDTADNGVGLVKALDALSKVIFIKVITLSPEIQRNIIASFPYNSLIRKMIKPLFNVSLSYLKIANLFLSRVLSRIAEYYIERERIKSSYKNFNGDPYLLQIL